MNTDRYGRNLVLGMLAGIALAVLNIARQLG